MNNNIRPIHINNLMTLYTLNHCLERDKWVLTNFDYDRQWFNTLISPLHESAAVYFVCSTFGNCDFSLSRPVRLSVLYTTPDIHCRDRRYECDGGIGLKCVCTNISGYVVMILFWDTIFFIRDVLKFFWWLFNKCKFKGKLYCGGFQAVTRKFPKYFLQLNDYSC